MIDAPVRDAGETPVNLMFEAVASFVPPDENASSVNPPEAGH